MTEPTDPFAAPAGGPTPTPPPPPGYGGHTPPTLAPAPYAPQYAAPSQYPPQPGSTSKDWMGIVSLVAAFVVPVGGIIFGHLAIQANYRREANNRGISFAGLLLSYALAAMWLLFFGFLFVWFPPVGITFGLLCLAGGLVGIAVGVRLKRGHTKTQWTTSEWGWTVGASSLITVIALALTVFSALFLVLWAGVGHSVSQGVIEADEPAPVQHVGGPVAADPSGGIPVGTTGVVGIAVPDGVTRIDIYEDFLCPICQQFEAINAADIEQMREAGTAQIYYHPISILDRYSQGTDYSTRAAAAAAVVADEAPEHYLDFSEALYANQPEEGTDGLSDDEIVAIAVSVGIPSDTAALVVDGRFYSWVGSATEQASIDGMQGTPTVMVNGVILDQSDVPYFEPGALRASIEGF